MARSRQMKEIAGSLAFYRTLQAREDFLQGVVQSTKAGWLRFTFQCESQKPHGLLSIRVEEADDPDEAPLVPAADERTFLASIGEFLQAAAMKDEFSGVVLIARRDEILFREAYGYADRTSKAPNTVDTRFNVGSMNKSFTQMAIHQLESVGKLSLSDTIGKFLPEYPNREAAATVTIQHLLRMESGIGDFFGERYEQCRKEDIRTLKDYLPLFADKPLEFSPGKQRRYSNGGYIVLGLIVERITGMEYYDYVARNIFTPAGMSRSGWFEKSDDRADIARGYTEKTRKPNYETLPQKGSSAGGGYCTAEDLLRYVQALRTRRLNLPGSDEGLGIAGGAPGLNAALEWLPGKDYVIVVLSNFDPPTAEKVARRIRQTLPESQPDR